MSETDCCYCRHGVRQCQSNWVLCPSPTPYTRECETEVEIYWNHKSHPDGLTWAPNSLNHAAQPWMKLGCARANELLSESIDPTWQKLYRVLCFHVTKFIDSHTLNFSALERLRYLSNTAIFTNNIYRDSLTENTQNVKKKIYKWTELLNCINGSRFFFKKKRSLWNVNHAI